MKVAAATVVDLFLADITSNLKDKLLEQRAALEKIADLLLVQTRYKDVELTGPAAIVVANDLAKMLAHEVAAWLERKRRA